MTTVLLALGAVLSLLGLAVALLARSTGDDGARQLGHTFAVAGQVLTSGGCWLAAQAVLTGHGTGASAGSVPLVVMTALAAWMIRRLTAKSFAAAGGARGLAA